MVNIIPAILPKDFNDLREKSASVARNTEMIHIDVCDGTLTPNSSWPYTNDRGEYQRITNEESGLPSWEETNFEVHLMVKDPESKYEEWVRAGVERVIVHIESFDTPELLSEFLLKLQKHFSLRDSYFGIEVGLAVNLDTSVESILPHLFECDFIHLMAIENIGFQGKSFDTKVLEKIEDLKNKYPETIISVDGGINMGNIKLLIERGVERLVVGSAVFAQEDPFYALEELKSIVE